MEKQKIKEKNIKKVVFSTEESSSEYVKFTKDATLYHVKYRYSSDFLGDNNYCSCCGEVFSSENTECPYCQGKNDDVLDYKNIGSMIYCSLDDGMKVTIYLWDGTVIKL